jgi:hypothetical protein
VAQETNNRSGTLSLSHPGWLVGPTRQPGHLLPPAGDYAGVTPEPAITPLFISLYSPALINE